MSNQVDGIHFLNDKTIFMVTICFSYYFFYHVFSSLAAFVMLLVM